MPIVVTGHERHAGTVVENGHCVRYLQVVGRGQVPHTSQWRRGAPVQGSSSHLAPGTAIATFDASGRYANATDGSSHAAILHAVHDDGSIVVYDQWQGQPVHMRTIRDRKGSGNAANDASRFYVIEVA